MHSESLDLLRNHGKATAGAAGARRLNGRIQREQVRLRRHVPDEIAHIVDLADRRHQPFHRADDRLGFAGRLARDVRRRARLIGNLLDRLRDLLGSHGDIADIRGRLFRRARRGIGLRLIIVGGLRHDLRATIHGLRRAIERLDDIIHRMLERPRCRLDLLAARFGLAGPLGIVLPRHSDVRDRLAEHQQRLRHAGDLVLTADRHRDIRFTFGNAAHCAVQQSQTADDVASDVKPGNQPGSDQRGNAEQDENDASKFDLGDRLHRQGLGDRGLMLNQAFHSGAQLGRISKRGGIDLLRARFVP